ncbi:MAG: hypothetical protein H0S80_04385 [Desulfovibrionaceae bacterium]|nr:hypothetical protein [Desulfovibrionaceae bacterium]
MNKPIFGLIIALVTLAASPALASLTYIYGGSEITAGTTSTYTAYNTVEAAYNDFSGRYASLQTETFEGFGSLVDQPNSSLGIAFGTITSGSAGYIGSTTTTQADYDETPLANSLYYYSNGTPGSASGKGDFTLDLDQAHHALGFYATDWHDQGGTVILEVGGVDGTGAGWTEFINVRDLTGTMDSGSLVYFSFFSDLAFDTVTFKASGGDGYGIDNLTVGAPTPIPGAVWLLGSGLIGLIGLRRRSA